MWNSLNSSSSSSSNNNNNVIYFLFSTNYSLQKILRFLIFNNSWTLYNNLNRGTYMYIDEYIYKL